MVTRLISRSAVVRQSYEVALGSAAKSVGRLVFVKDGRREFSQFSFSESWLADENAFDISPDLTRAPGFQSRKPSSENDSCFFAALADTEPDTWGRRVIARAHAKKRAADPSLTPLCEIDYLVAVDDTSRVGALRLRDSNGCYLRTVSGHVGSTPVFLELEKILNASRNIELSEETAQDLAYLQGKATSLGGMRPKCTLLDTDGTLAIGKFPSVGDLRSVTQGEVLALHLATLAGIQSADARIELVGSQPIAVIRRFDRTLDQQRIPYLSAASLLQARRGEEQSYTQLVDVMRSKCRHFVDDARQLWRRLIFNFLITNVDDHLQNTGFLYCGSNQWRLAPAFDLNPFPDKLPESKTWLSEDSGPITSIAQLLEQSVRFEVSPAEAKSIAADVETAVSRWRTVATSDAVGLPQRALADFAPAFRNSLS